MEVMADAFWDYVAKTTTTADDTLAMIRKSQFGQDIRYAIQNVWPYVTWNTMDAGNWDTILNLNLTFLSSARLAESTDLANTYAMSVQEQLPPAALDMITKVTTEAEVLRERVITELDTVREKLEPYTEDIKAKIQQRVEQLKQELAPYADSVDPEALRTTLTQKSEELKTNLEQTVKDLQAQLAPYADDLKQKVDEHLETFKESVAPMTERVQSEVTQRAQQVKELAAPYVDDLREKLDPYIQDIPARLGALFNSFVKAK